ncbi:hypothetical protein [Xanthomarina sp. GH4-25]|uniref:hypothetical protein n=1 Tax=Xanthomarina sp. GH4-25 TaxID=3349335 RepID=UPI000D67838F|nr:hypothetical protein DI383_13220 [Flavobacteriaceae bacterium LYZ1037]
MKKLISFLFIISITFTLKAQESPENYASYVETLDSTLETLYSVISGEKGEERDWGLFKHLFKPDAKLIPTSKNKEGVYILKYLSPSDYITTSGSWLIENGFFEKEIHRQVNTYGNITQVFSTYESFQSITDTEPFMRGINSIQLLNDGERWWIVNVYWTQETLENPIPIEYLPKN